MGSNPAIRAIGSAPDLQAPLGLGELVRADYVIAVAEELNFSRSSERVHIDSIYHELDRSGQHHMEYVNKRGAFDDMQLATVVAYFERLSGEWPGGLTLRGAIIQQDVEREAA